MESTKEQMAPDALKAASNVYKLLLDEDRVRVLRVYFRPGDKAAMHHHPDHAVYVAKGGRIQITTDTGQTETMDMEAGKSLFIESETHEAKNIGDTDLELIVIELK